MDSENYCPFQYKVHHSANNRIIVIKNKEPRDFLLPGLHKSTPLKSDLQYKLNRFSLWQTSCCKKQPRVVYHGTKLDFRILQGQVKTVKVLVKALQLFQNPKLELSLIN